LSEPESEEDFDKNRRLGLLGAMIFLIGIGPEKENSLDHRIR
jgi:hypothetical protein